MEECRLARSFLMPGGKYLRSEKKREKEEVVHCTALHCTALHCTVLHCLDRDIARRILVPASDLLCEVFNST
jgi:hypothetical protein